MGEEFHLQVGNQDFFIDLFFFHRGLSTLVVFELKIGKFSPEHPDNILHFLLRILLCFQLVIGAIPGGVIMTFAVSAMLNSREPIPETRKSV